MELKERNSNNFKYCQKVVLFAKKLCYLLKIKDVLKKNVKLSRIDLIFCFIKGIIKQ